MHGEPLLDSERSNMNPDSEKNRIIEKMFDAAIKEKLGRLARKYGQKSVVEVWTEMVRNQELESHLSKWRWSLEMTINEALERLDGYCNSIETTIQNRFKGEKDSLWHHLQQHELHHSGELENHSDSPFLFLFYF
jgi:hypothetical protein